MIVLLSVSLSSLFVVNLGTNEPGLDPGKPVLTKDDLRNLFEIGKQLAQIPEVGAVIGAAMSSELSRPPSEDESIIASYEVSVCSAAVSFNKLENRNSVRPKRRSRCTTRACIVLVPIVLVVRCAAEIIIDHRNFFVASKINDNIA